MSSELVYEIIILKNLSFLRKTISCKKTTYQIHCERGIEVIYKCLVSGKKKPERCKADSILDKSFCYRQRILRKEVYIDAVTRR